VNPAAFSVQKRSQSVANAIDFTMTNAPGSGLIVGTPTLVSGKTQVVLTFQPNVAGRTDNGGSLLNGNYQLAINSAGITSGATPLDGDANGVAGGDFLRGNVASDNFFRLLGDADGSGVVNLIDVNSFYAPALNSNSSMANFNASIDANHDGVINLLDIDDPLSTIDLLANFNTNRGFM
jgi:hypothetical protein